VSFASAPVRVLIVDDNVDAAVALSTLLEQKGYFNLLLHDGFRVLEAALRLVPDVILMDIEMPGINGYQVATLIRQEESLDRTLLIAVTGWSDHDHRKNAMQAGFDIYLVKPVRAEEIFALLVHATGGTLARTLSPQ
jgi:CheY-like chemotaxis protein